MTKDEFREFLNKSGFTYIGDVYDKEIFIGDIRISFEDIQVNLGDFKIELEYQINKDIKLMVSPFLIDNLSEKDIITEFIKFNELIQDSKVNIYINN